MGDRTVWSEERGPGHYCVMKWENAGWVGWILGALQQLNWVFEICFTQGKRSH